MLICMKMTMVSTYFKKSEDKKLPRNCLADSLGRQK